MTGEQVGWGIEWLLVFIYAPLLLYGLMIPLCAALLAWFCVQNAATWICKRLGWRRPNWAVSHIERPNWDYES